VPQEPARQPIHAVCTRKAVTFLDSEEVKGEEIFRTLLYGCLFSLGGTHVSPT
jgi:hypothetical protein